MCMFLLVLLIRLCIYSYIRMHVSAFCVRVSFYPLSLPPSFKLSLFGSSYMHIDILQEV